MTLSSTAEGAHKQMETYLDQMVDGIVGFLKDPVIDLMRTITLTLRKTSTLYLTITTTFFLFQHPRVRYAACNCIGQMATDFAPTFQKKYHTKVCLLSQKHPQKCF